MGIKASSAHARPGPVRPAAGAAMLGLRAAVDVNSVGVFAAGDAIFLVNRAGYHIAVATSLRIAPGDRCPGGPVSSAWSSATAARLLSSSSSAAPARSPRRAPNPAPIDVPAPRLSTTPPAEPLIAVPRASFRPVSEEQAASHNAAAIAAPNLIAGMRLHSRGATALMNARLVR
jgi:hypothetical protein